MNNGDRTAAQYRAREMKRRQIRKRLSAVMIVLAIILCILGAALALDLRQSPGDGFSAGGEPEGSTSQSEKKPAEQRADTGSNAPQTDKQTVHFLAVGDNLIHDDIYADAKERGEGEYVFTSMYEGVAEQIAAADVAYVNQEGPVAKSFSISGYPSFNAPTAIADDLRQVGFNVINLANNHMTDQGAKGVAETTQLFSALDGVTAIGGYTEEDFDNIRVVEKNGIKIAFLSYTTFTNANANSVLSNGCVIPYPTEECIDRQVALAKNVGDVVVVSMHWGAENITQPNAEMTRWANYLASKNVDVVLGMHSHTLMPITWLDGEDGHKTLVTYSLGNFFGGMLSVGNLVGGLFTFDIVKTQSGVSIENAQLTPTVIHYEGQYSANADNRHSFGVHLMKNYTEQMAQRHGVSVTLDSLKRQATQVIDEAFLNLE